MADALAVAVRTGIFCGRNVEKTNEGHAGKALVCAGQAANLWDYVNKLDNKVGDFAKGATQTLNGLAKNNKLLEGAGKVVDFASKNVNLLIGVSAGIDVLNSDDKEKALVTNATALGSMFAVEGLMKKHLDSVHEMKGIKNIAEKLVKFEKNNHCEGKLQSIIKGVAFVVGSCTAYNVGSKFGELVIDKARGTKEESADS